MTLTTTRMLSPDAKPIFLDFEVDHIGDKTGTLPNVTQIGVYDPEKKLTFHAHIKPSNMREIYAPHVSFTDEQSQVPRYEFKEVWPELQKWVRQGQNDRKVVFIAHNCYKHDMKLLENELSRLGQTIPRDWSPFCTLYLAGSLYGRNADKSLQTLRHNFGIEPNRAHHAGDDAKTLYKVFKKMIGNTKEGKLYSLMLTPKDQGPVKAVAAAIKTHQLAIPFFFDTETTGLDTDNDRIVEYSMYTPVEEGDAAWYSTFVNPKVHIPEEASRIHHIYDRDVAGAPKTHVVLLEIVEKVKAVMQRFPNGVPVFIAHNNYGFDWKIMRAEFERYGMKLPGNWKAACTFRISRSIRKGYNTGFSHKLQDLRKHFGIPETENAHRAYDDVGVLYQVFQKMIGNADPNKVYQAMLKPSPSVAVAQVVRDANPNMFADEQAAKANVEFVKAKESPFVQSSSKSAKKPKIIHITEAEVPQFLAPKKTAAMASSSRRQAVVVSDDEESDEFELDIHVDVPPLRRLRKVHQGNELPLHPLTMPKAPEDNGVQEVKRGEKRKRFVS